MPLWRSCVSDIIRSGLHELTHRPAAQVPALDALRSAAILLVVCGHYIGADGGAPESPLGQFVIFQYGWVGVDLFFILSGLLIGRQLWRELFSTGTVQVGRFLLRRGYRIWPLYFFFLIVPAVVTLGRHARWPDWVFLSDYYTGALPGGWSLSTEEQFYISVPLLMITLRRFVKGSTWFLLLVGLIGVELLGRFITVAEYASRGLSRSEIAGATRYNFHLHFSGLIIGLMIALLSQVRPEWFARREGRFSWRGMAVFAGATSLAVAVHGLADQVFPYFALALLFGGLTVWVLWDASFLSRPLNSRVFYVISRLAYGMYLNHIFIMVVTGAWAVPVLVRAFGNTPPAFFLGLLFTIVASVLVATVTFVLVEHPFLQMRERWLEESRAK
jgi:peptidoglycan/LPS O-acetylase OafA/YrhL